MELKRLCHFYFGYRLELHKSLNFGLLWQSSKYNVASVPRL